MKKVKNHKSTQQRLKVKGCLNDYMTGMSMGFLFFPVDNTLDKIMTNEEAWESDWKAIGDDMRTAMWQIGDPALKKSDS